MRGTGIGRPGKSRTLVSTTVPSLATYSITNRRGSLNGIRRASSCSIRRIRVRLIKALHFVKGVRHRVCIALIFRIPLHSWPTRVIDVLIVEITAKRRNNMTSNTEATETALAPAAQEPKASKPGRAGARRAPVAPKKTKSGKKAKAGKKAPKSPKKATGARDGSKTAKILDLLKRPDGVTQKELMKVTGWQPHSVRGLLSGIVGKKMGLTVTSTKGEDGQRTYSVKA